MKQHFSCRHCSLGETLLNALLSEHGFTPLNLPLMKQKLHSSAVTAVQSTKASKPVNLGLFQVIFKLEMSGFDQNNVNNEVKTFLKAKILFI